MKIRLVSDLHLEFSNFILPRNSGEDQEVLCLCGDINPIKDILGTRIFFEGLQNRFKAVIYVAGNHEYYHSSLLDQEILEDLCSEFGYIFLQNSSVQIQDTVFLGGTLWTDFNNNDLDLKRKAQRAMNDYSVIKDSELNLLHPDIIYKEHKKTSEFIFSEIKRLNSEEEDKKIVVLTHHAPHALSVHEKYRKGMLAALNPLYYSDLSKEISEVDFNLWCHGHTHTNFDYNLGNKRVVCNPRGYDKWHPENSEFNPNLTIELDINQ